MRGLVLAGVCLAVESLAIVVPKEPLHLAVLDRNAQRVTELIAGGADVNKVDERYGCTALHLAAREGNLDIVRLLRKAGAKLYAANKNGEPLVFAAVSSGSTNLVAFLLGEGASAKSRNADGESVIHQAILCRHADMVRYLVGLGVDVNAKDKKGWAPLHQAAYVGDVPVVEDLVKAGADVNATSWHKETPLHLAADYNHTNALVALVGVKADPDLADDTGDTALFKTTSPEIVGVLLKAGANPNRSNRSRYTPLSGAVGRNDGLAMVKALVAGGADVNRRIDGDRTAIFDAIPTDKVDVFRYLVEKGADLGVRDAAGETPLDWVKSYKAKRIAEYLAQR